MRGRNIIVICKASALEPEVLLPEDVYGPRATRIPLGARRQHDLCAIPSPALFPFRETGTAAMSTADALLRCDRGRYIGILLYLSQTHSHVPPTALNCPRARRVALLPHDERLNDHASKMLSRALFGDDHCSDTNRDFPPFISSPWLLSA